MDLQSLFFTVTYKIIHVTVMSQTGMIIEKKELKLLKCCFFMFYR